MGGTLPETSVSFRKRVQLKLGRTVENICVDLLYGGSCARWKRTPYKRLGSRDTESSAYAQLRTLFDPARVPIRSNDVLVDIGCGRGRVINFWLKQGYRNRLFGIELDESIARLTRERLRSYRNVTILSGDALELLPAEATLFYLFNPFILPGC
jgi:SAM-dependent methyltransferase